MSFFLRFTNTAKNDLKRGTSIHATGYDKTICSKKAMSELLGCDVSDIKIVNGLYVQVLNGICGYLLEAETIEEAIEEVNDNSYQFDFVGRAVIFKGRYVENDVPDGDLFCPTSIQIEL
jgi:acyl CoA:acetate/3-ketoacid CoA transferase alpha subunit